MANLYERVAARALVAKEFNTQKELQEYLKSHPDADRKRHKVKKPSAPGGKKQPPPIPDKAKGKPEAPSSPAKGAPVPPPPAGKKPAQPPPLPPKAPAAQPPVDAKPHAKAPGHAPEPGHDEHGEPAGPKKSWKERFRELSDHAKDFVRKAPAEVKQFISNPEARAATLKEAQGHLASAPRKAVHRLVETAKHEIKEFKDAAEGVKAVMRGGKMTKHQKHAFKTVATHIAIGAAAAALTATGPLGAAGAFAKGIARHIAAKAVHHTFEKAHLLDELGHIGHGISHLMEHFAADGDGQPNPEEVLGNFVMAAVAKELEKVTDDDLMAALNGMGAEKVKKEAARRVVARFLSG